MLASTLLMSLGPKPVTVLLCLGRVKLAGPTGPLRSASGALVEGLRSRGEGLAAILMMSIAEKRELLRECRCRRGEGGVEGRMAAAPGSEAQSLGSNQTIGRARRCKLIKPRGSRSGWCLRRIAGEQRVFTVVAGRSNTYTASRHESGAHESRQLPEKSEELSVPSRRAEARGRESMARADSCHKAVEAGTCAFMHVLVA